MKDSDKTKEQLMSELEEMRRRVAELEALELEYRHTEEKLREKEHMVDSALSVTATCGLDGIMTYVNPSFLKVGGFASDGEVIGRDFSEFWVVKDRLDEILGALRSKGSWTDEIEATKKDGTLFDVQVLASTVYDRNGNATGLMSSSVDITERKQMEGELKEYRNSLDRQVKQQTEELRIANEQLEAELAERKKAEEALRESEEQYRSIVNLSGEVGEVVIMLQDTDQGEGIQAFVSDEWSHITGYSREELSGGSFFNLVHPKDRKASQERHRSKIKGEDIPGLFEMTIIRKDGTEIPVELTSAYTTYKGGHANVVYIRDITERKMAEEKIKASLAEKELLLKEVHHRVKNNMQVISSLLKLGAGAVKNKEDAVVFKDSQNRIKSMALVYNKLYQAEDLANIDFGEYVRDLARNLAPSYKAVSGRVTTSVESSGVHLGVDQAIPCGLVVNELLTNSLKYAFPRGRGGEIRVSLGESENTGR